MDVSRKREKKYPLISIIIGIAIISCLFGCDNSNILRDLERNQLLWESHQFIHYKYSIAFIGYGFEYARMPIQVEIQNDNILSAIDKEGVSLSENNPNDDEYFYLYGISLNQITIDGLFKYLRVILSKKPSAIRISYDIEYGFPREIYIDQFREPCCQDFTIEITNFQVIQ